jgi:acyl-CoA thioesterase-2
MKLSEILDMSDHGPDVVVGTGPTYPWGGLYGGQIVAQALVAAGRTVDVELPVHSVRAYFIRRGDHHEPVRYEIDRIRNGRSFCTRRVVARQSGGAILNLEASFQRHEGSADIETVHLDAEIPPPSVLAEDSWSPVFSRAFCPEEQSPARFGGGRAAAWLRVDEDLGDDPLVHAAALAYLSDDLPTDAVVRTHPVGREPREVRQRVLFSASLDHTIWFHRPGRADRWNLHDLSCHSFTGGRGLALGHVHAEDGTHVATIAQEVLLRDDRQRRSTGN